MYPLSDSRFADFFRRQRETGVGYWVVTAVLEDGRKYDQVLVDSGCVTRVRNYDAIPFTEAEIDRFIVTLDKWEW